MAILLHLHSSLIAKTIGLIILIPFIEILFVYLVSTLTDLLATYPHP